MTIQEIRAIEARLPTAMVSSTDVIALLAEVRRLRQGLWDCAAISGADTDGDRTPDHMTYPDIVEYAKREVQSLRDDYDEALVEVKH